MTADPAESSFAKAMALSVGTLSVLDKDGVVFSRIWCAHPSSLQSIAKKSTPGSRKLVLYFYWPSFFACRLGLRSAQVLL